MPSISTSRLCDTYLIILIYTSFNEDDGNDHLDEEEVHVDGDDEGYEEEGGGPEELVHLNIKWRDC